jgi:adenylate cyclase
MVDALADTARNAGKSPQDEKCGAFAFAGLVFDLDACTLKRESGEAIALTRGEFALLREFVRRPGRVLSRDLLLDAMAGRRNVPFDRSVDVMVGRLRRKVEPDPKQPSVIQTVPGEGYRFNAPLSACQPPAETIASTTAASPVDATIPPPAANPPTWRALWPVFAAAIALCLIATAAAIQWRPAPQERGPRLSIVVLPFENISGDKEQDYFADGITDDLTTDLSHLQDSFVISRGTAFTYRGKPLDAREIGKELGVRYLLEGSVRRLGEKVEVNARLVSTETGAEVWADRFEGERSRLGAMQVDVVSRLANSLGVELVKAEALRSTRERPGNPDAADLAMQAQVKRNLPDSKATRNEAVALAERALALDPRNVRALTVLAAALLDRVGDQWSDDPAGDLARAEKASDAARALQPENSSVHYVKGYLYLAKEQWAPSIMEFETATALDPNNAKAYADAGLDKIFLGHAEDGFAGVETALRLSPRDPQLPWWQFYMSVFHAQLAQWEQAIPWCSKSAAGQPEVFFPLADLAAAYAWLGRDKEAKDTAAQLQKVYPGFTVQTWAGIHRHFSGDPTFNTRFQLTVEGLRKAGVPEGEAKKD